MNPGTLRKRFVTGNAGRSAILVAAIFLAVLAATRTALAACSCGKTWPHLRCASLSHPVAGHPPGPGDISDIEFGGIYHWVRSPEQERRVVMNLYNRYCIRCHGVDGRGVWDIPDVPDFTNTVWQATRPEAYRSRVVLEGRGAVMPTFRGVITLEEACALARYLNTFVPGSEVSRPGLGHENPPASGQPPTGPPTAATPAPPTVSQPVTPPPSPTTVSPFTR